MSIHCQTSWSCQTSLSRRMWVHKTLCSSELVWWFGFSFAGGNWNGTGGGRWQWLFVCLILYLFICLFIYSFICFFFVCLCVCPSVRFSVCLPIYLSICLSVCLFACWFFSHCYTWLVVSTHLKNIIQIGSFPHVGMKIKKHIWNHQPDTYSSNNPQISIRSRVILFRPPAGWMAAWLAGCKFQNLQPKEMAVRKVEGKTLQNEITRMNEHPIKTCAGCNYVKKLMKMMKGDPNSIHVFRFCSPNACHWPWSFGKTCWWRGIMSVRYILDTVLIT